MTQSGEVPDHVEEFVPSADAESVEASLENEPLNVCRAGMLGAFASGDPNLVTDSGPELRALGFLSTERMEDSTNGPTQKGERFRADIALELASVGRIELWTQFNDLPTVGSAKAILLQQFMSPWKRESVAAAASLWNQMQNIPELELDEGFRELSENKFYLSMSFPKREEVLRWVSGSGASRVETDVWFNPDYNSEEWPSACAEYLKSYSEGESGLLAALKILLRLRLEAALASVDPFCVELARAALMLSDGGGGSVPIVGGGGADGPRGNGGNGPPGGINDVSGILTGERGGGRISTIIHGTNAWKGNWWRPTGAFHLYIRKDVRTDLYSSGARYSWGGSYSDADRGLAAKDFCEWAKAMTPAGINTLFGHSYGAEVAARAVNLGAAVNEIVLLSAPVTRHVEVAIAKHPKMEVRDIRLHWDPVLAIAQCNPLQPRVRQRIPASLHGPRVKELTLGRASKWQLRHGATHEPLVWRSERLYQSL